MVVVRTELIRIGRTTLRVPSIVLMKRSALPFGAGPIGPGADALEAECSAGDGVHDGGVAGAVVGHDAFDLDAVKLVESRGAA
jgi:hypothetical protein